MIVLHDMLSGELIYRLGWTLLHSLWQGLVAAAVFGILLLFIPRSKAGRRYVAGCACLLALALGCGATFLTIQPRADHRGSSKLPVASLQDPVLTPSTPSKPGIRVHVASESSTGDDWDPWFASSEGRSPAPSSQSPVADSSWSSALPISHASLPERMMHPLRTVLAPHLPWLAVLWLLGVLSISTWRFGGLVATYRLRRIGTAPVARELRERVMRLAADLRVSRPVRVLQSAVACTPSVIGHFRPVILLPLRAITGLSPRELEAILAHELAHIRRYDYLANIVQTAIETLFFHHPAVWWICRRIRAERENCCDDLAVALCGDRLTYARALAQVEQLGSAGPTLAAAASGGSLLTRIQRVADVRCCPSERAPRWIAGAIAMAVVSAITLGLAMTGVAASTEDAASHAEESAAMDQTSGTDPETPAAEATVSPDPADETASSQSLLPPSETVSGVVEERGFPRAQVAFSNLIGEWTGKTRSDKEGRFALTDLAPEQTHWVALWSPGDKMGLFTISPETAGGPLRVALDLRAGKVEGRVVDANGHPLSAREVEMRVILPDGTTFPAALRKTDQNGYFDQHNVPFGEGFQLELRLASAEDGRPWLAPVPLPAQEVALELSDLVDRDVAPQEGPPPPPGRIPYSGRVLCENGHPLPGVIVSLTYPVSEGMVHVAKARTDVEGKWTRQLPASLSPRSLDPQEERFLPPAHLERARNPVSIRAEHPEYYLDRSDAQASKATLEHLRAGTAIVVMNKGLEVRGRVFDPQGNPVADALVQGSQPWLGPQSEENANTTRTDREGRFRLRNVPAGRGEFAVYAKGYAPWRRTVTAAANLPELRIELSVGHSVRGNVVDPEGQPVEGASVRATEWWLTRSAPLDAAATTDNQGRFELINLPAQGTFSIVYSKSPFLPCQIKDVIAREEPYQFTLYRPTVIEGQVVDAKTGEPITKLTVTEGFIWSPEFASPAVFRNRQELDSPDGRFRWETRHVTATPPYPKFGVRIEAEGYEPAESPFVEVGEMIEPLEIALRRREPGAPLKEPEEARDRVAVPVSVVADMLHRLLQPPDTPYDESPTAAEGPFHFEIQVVNSEGQPLEDSECRIYSHAVGSNRWRRSDGGTIRYTRMEMMIFTMNVHRVDAVVRAPGYAPALLQLDQPQSASVRRTVTLERGRDVDLMLIPESRRLPEDLAPVICFSDHIWQVRGMANRRTSGSPDDNMTFVETVSPGHYRFRLGTETPAFRVFVNHPGFLRSYDAGPFTSDDFIDGRLEIRLPQPAALTARFDPPKDFEGELPYDLSIIQVARYDPPGGNRLYIVAEQRCEDRNCEIMLHDLPPGEYDVHASTMPGELEPPPGGREAHPGMFRSSSKTVFEPGQSAEVAITFVPFDPHAYRGDHAATLRVLDFAGEPPAGKPFTITYSAPNYGRLTVLEGSLPDDGRVDLQNVAPGRREADQIRDGRTHFSLYTLEVDGKRIADFDLADVEAGGELELRRAPGVNDPAPDVELIDLWTHQTLPLSQFRGKPVFIEFWSTWCGPCRPEMDRLVEIVRRRPAWLEKAEVLAVSIDDRIETVRDHVRRAGWESVQHAWSGGEGRGFWSPAARAFGINSIPHALLIDGEGTIVWRGHPNQFDLEAHMEKLD